MAVGSRGDVAPYTGLGAGLTAAGHSVAIATYKMFAGLVTSSGLEFRALPGDPGRQGFSEDGEPWEQGAAPGPLGVARFMRVVADHMRDVQSGILEAARQGTDVMLVSGMGLLGGYRVAEGLGIPSAGLAVQPIHPTGEFPPPTVMTRSLGPWGNRTLAQAVLTLGGAFLERSSRQLWKDEGLPASGTRGIYRRQDNAAWPVFYGFSPAVVPRPRDWRAGLEIAGYWWPARPAGWTPPPDLENFLAAGPPPVFVGFGSRNPSDAGRLNEVIGAAQRHARVRMVIQAGWAGLGTASQAADDTMVIGEVPHDWLFPRMAAVVHPASAGTTGAGLRAGVPSVTIPLSTDQPFWASRLAACGVGPAPVAYKHLTGPALGAAITDAVTRESYRDRAQALASWIAEEDGIAPVARSLAAL
ncbi:MAG: glycosyltransferase [Streptosporangiales bacterium]|nr:glycosyltransferase [Streptosporangiales bacterium]